MVCDIMQTQTRTNLEENAEVVLDYDPTFVSLSDYSDEELEEMIAQAQNKKENE